MNARYPRVLWLFLISAALCRSSWAGQYFQDFSSASIGATNLGDGSALFSGGQPSNVVGVVDATYKELQLTDVSVGNTRAAFLLPDLDNTSKVFAFSAKFNAAIFAPFTNGADGLSFTFGPVRPLTLWSGIYTQEDGYGTGVTFSIRTYQGNSPGFYIRVNGSSVSSVAYNALTQWGSNNPARHFFEIDWNSTAGMSVKMDGTNIFSNVPTANFRPMPGDAFVFAARCGAITETIRLDNIVVMTGGNLVKVPMVSPYYKSAEFVIAGQTADKAFDGINGTKWLATNETASYVGATCSSNARGIRVYSFMAAEDIPARDPKIWRVEGSNNSGTNWSTVGTGTVQFINRNEERAFITTNASAFAAFRMNILTNNGDAHTQLAELKFYEFQTYSPFSLNLTSITTTAQGTILWADYDNDGRLDLSSGGIMGLFASGIELWHNEGNGNFTKVTNTSLGNPVDGRGRAWVDVDNDGDQDYVHADSGGVYRNNGDGTFTSIADPAFQATFRNAIVALDYDNDGYMDIYSSGASYSTFERSWQLLHNNGDGTFSQDTRSSFEGLFDCALAAGDFNRDGYVDILQEGRNYDSFTTVTYATRLYTNRGDGVFFLYTNTVPTGYFAGSCDFIDYDNDGWLDFNNDGNSALELWHATGTGGFSKVVSTFLHGIQYGKLSWGDFDADGRPDAGESGYMAYNIYYNKSEGAFVDAGAPPYFQYDSGNGWADYDNDGALDWASNGSTNAGGGQQGTILLHNELGVSNAAPSTPATLAITNQSGFNVTLTWSASTDDSTHAPGLSYDVRLGTTPGGKQIVSPPANTTNGQRRLAQPGRVRGQTRMILDLPLGTYFWSVQAVDQGHAGSAFSTQMSFTVSSGGGAPTCTTVAAIGVNASTEALRGSVDPNGLPTAIWFEWGATTNYGNVTTPGTQNFVNVSLFSSNITDLATATLYHYRVFASNSLGVSTGLNVSFTTLGGSPGVTTQPAIELGPTNATLVGSANPNFVTSFAWFAWGSTTNLGATTPSQPIGNGGANVTFTNRITGLTSASTYFYRAFSSNQFGAATGSLVNFTTVDTNVLLDATTPNTTITGSSGNTPGGQTPPQAIDNVVATKYLNLDKLNTGFDVTVFDTSRIVRGLTLISAEDAAERDPASYTFEGSLDGTNFTLIASNAVPSFGARNEIQSVSFPNASAYPVYRVRFPNVVDAGAANSMQISEVELLPAPEITSSNDAVGGSFFGLLMIYTPALVDRHLDNASKFYITSNTGPATVNIVPAAGRSVLKGLEIIGAADDATYPQRHPTNFIVRGSDDGFTYVPLGAFTSTTPTANQRIEEYTLFGNTTPYNRYQIEFGKQPSGVDMQIGEVRLFGDVLTPLDRWRYDEFGTTNNAGDAANNSDPEGDGNANLLEFASGTDPAVSNSSPLFRISVSNASPGVFYIKDTNAIGTVTWIVESARDPLNAWSNRNGSSQEVDSNEPIHTIRFDPTPPVATNESFRLKVTLP